MELANWLARSTNQCARSTWLFLLIPSALIFNYLTDDFEVIDGNEKFFFDMNWIKYNSNFCFQSISVSPGQSVIGHLVMIVYIYDAL